MATYLRGALTSRWTWIAIGVMAGSSLIAGLSYRQSRDQAAMAPQPEGAYCDIGIGAAKARVAAAAFVSPVASAEWTPKLNDGKPDVPPPAGMVWVSGGQFWMGADDSHMNDTKPWHRVYVDGFWMDRTEVTNEEFAAFVKATGYITIAERKPRQEDYPGAPPENLVAGSVVFTPPNHSVKLNDQFQWWSYVHATNWRHPEGPGSDIKTRMKHPVVQVAYADAVAFAQWAGKRLPTEAEFEFAARGKLDRKRYDWGDEFMPGGKYMANTFQGHFPDHNSAEDGYASTARVASFPANGYGLFDMAGNVWEWTLDWYRPDYYATLAATGDIAVNPAGPADSFDPSEPKVAKRVQRGGSFLCTDQYCARYIAGGRGKGEPDTGTNHLGFRCVRDPQMSKEIRRP